MLSESARSTSSAESRFRVQAPNAMARDILVIALDEESAKLGTLLAGQPWRRTQFVNFRRDGDAPAVLQTWLGAMEQRDFDLIVMVGSIGSKLDLAADIGSRCIDGGVKISSVLLAPAAASSRSISAGLLALRPWSVTLAVIAEAEYLPGVLHALGA